MTKYGWDLSDLQSKANEAFDLSKKSKRKEERKNYLDLYNEYLRLINIILDHDGKLKKEKEYSIDKLREIRFAQGIDDYSDKSKEIRSSILASYKEFSKLPKVSYDTRIPKDLNIYLLADIIKTIFGDDNYKVYLERIISSPNMLQFTRGDGESLSSLFIKDGNESLYTSVVDKNNIGFLSDLAHEAGHGYRFITNEYMVYPDNKLIEFESFSYQIRVLDFMIKNNIYRKDAIKAMIKLMNQIENIIIMLKNSDLQYAKHIQHLTHMAHNRDLYSRTNLPNTREILRYLEFIKCEYVLPYIYSAMAVFDTLESDTSLDRYRMVVKDIGIIDEDELAASIVENPNDFNNLNNYRSYREKILTLYRDTI